MRQNILDLLEHLCYYPRHHRVVELPEMELKLSDSELDLPPEYCHYRDEGCEIHESCLSCPLPACAYEVPGGKQRWLKRQRNRQIARAFINEGKGVKELAQSFGVSIRTVQRVLKSYIPKGKERGQND